ncbi:MAG TPA: SRPBCC domain-containing protein [Gemmatimonadaceae bacterium]|nr:SRPBCC domain-containing protein [Gemmatimonadaceae bacterium]
MPTTTAPNQRDAPPAESTLFIKRTFDAPRDLVWQAWSDAEQAKQWWGPEGFTAPIVELDERPGGKWRALMRSPDGKDMWQHGVYREIVPPEFTSYTFVWDEQPDHEMLVTVRFAERGDKTEMTFKQGIFNSAEERDSHKEGWNETFDRFAAYLQTRKGGSNARR